VQSTEAKKLHLSEEIPTESFRLCSAQGIPGVSVAGKCHVRITDAGVMSRVCTETITGLDVVLASSEWMYFAVAGLPDEQSSIGAC
jgi:hypothetical protein